MEYPREYGGVHSPVSPCSNQKSQPVETSDLQRDLPVPNLGEEKYHDHGWNKHNGYCGNISLEYTFHVYMVKTNWHDRGSNQHSRCNLNTKIRVV